VTLNQMTLSILNINVTPSLIDLIAECRIFIVILGVILERVLKGIVVMVSIVR